MKTLNIFLFSCASIFASDKGSDVVTVAKTNAAYIYVKDVFTRDGQTNLIRITKISEGQVSRIYRFYHAGQLVANFVASSGESVFNTEATPYCMSVKYGPVGEILSARIGDKNGVPLDEFSYANGIFLPVEDPFKRSGLMKPMFGDEAEFVKRNPH